VDCVAQRKTGNDVLACSVLRVAPGMPHAPQPLSAKRAKLQHREFFCRNEKTKALDWVCSQTWCHWNCLKWPTDVGPKAEPGSPTSRSADSKLIFSLENSTNFNQNKIYNISVVKSRESPLLRSKSRKWKSGRPKGGPVRLPKIFEKFRKNKICGLRTSFWSDPMFRFGENPL
jgi:hypothetical protein